MDGINAATGKTLGDIAHLRQSVRDILTTPLGTRVMRRDYGSKLPRLVDAPINKTTLMDIIAATAVAIGRWEPRFKVRQVKIATASPGHVVLDVTGNYLPNGQEITLDGIEIK
jgi:uncharacterized protein